jgi:hypothetical protein
MNLVVLKNAELFSFLLTFCRLHVYLLYPAFIKEIYLRDIVNTTLETMKICVSYTDLNLKYFFISTLYFSTRLHGYNY